MDWQVAMRPGQRRKLEPGSLATFAERVKSSIRAKSLLPTAIGGGHPFLDVKGHFDYAKVRYRGLAKNTERLALLLGLSNLKRSQRCLAAS